MDREIVKVFCLTLVILTLISSCRPTSGWGTQHVLVEDGLVYSAVVKRVAARVVDLTWPLEPLSYDEFKPIYMHPEAYLNSAMLFVDTCLFSEIEFGIVLLSMHKLGYKEYLRFSESCFEAYKKGKITDRMFLNTLNGLYANVQIKRNRRKRSVKTYLDKLMSEKEISPLIIQEVKNIQKGNSRQ